MYVCMCVCVQSVLWLRAPMDEWLDTLSVNMTTRVRIPLSVLFLLLLFFFFLFLLAWADICAAELATWGVGPDVFIRILYGGFNTRRYTLMHVLLMATYTPESGLTSTPRQHKLDGVSPFCAVSTECGTSGTS